MNKLDRAYNQLKELSKSKNYNHYLHGKYYEYKQQLKTINKTLGKEMEHIQDNRTPEEHFIDICRGWLVEDVFAYLFSLPQYNELILSFDNHDQDRIIRVLRKQITAAPDFKITYQDQTIKVEVQSLFANMPYFHIKEHKAKKLTDNNSYLIQFKCI
jgi:phosphopantetheine adenylyltransferase